MPLIPSQLVSAVRSIKGRMYCFVTETTSVHDTGSNVTYHIEIAFQINFLELLEDRG